MNAVGTFPDTRHRRKSKMNQNPRRRVSRVLLRPAAAGRGDVQNAEKPVKVGQADRLPGLFKRFAKLNRCHLRLFLTVTEVIVNNFLSLLFSFRIGTLTAGNIHAINAITFEIGNVLY